MTSAPLSVEQQLAVTRQLCPDLAPLIEVHVVPRLSGAGEGAKFTVKRVLELMSEAKAHQAEDTRRTRANIYKKLFTDTPALAFSPINALTPDVVDAALTRSWPNSPTSWNRGRCELATLINYARRRQWVRMDNPAEALDKRHVEEKEIHALPPDRLSALMDAALADRRHGDLLPYIAICAFAGVRPTEARRLTWGDVNLKEGVISVRRAKSKTGGTRHIEMHPTLRAWLEFSRPADATPQDGIARGTVISRQRRLHRAAGFGPSCPWIQDCLRHSYATYYLLDGGRLPQLQLNMGHRDTQLLYARYVNMAGVTRSAARAWWRITPDYILNIRARLHKTFPGAAAPAA